MRNRRGFSIIEALIVVAIGSFVIVVILGLLSFSTKSFERTQQRLDPREGASRILLAVRNAVVDSQPSEAGPAYRISEEGRQLLFQTPRAIGGLTYEPWNRTVYLINSQTIDARPEIVATNVVAFSIHQLRRGVLRVSLELERPHVEDGLADLGNLKVVDEVYCPAAGGRQGMIPWNKAYEPRKRRRGRRPNA